MTLTEACVAIEAETHTRTWAEAQPALRVLVIKGIVEQIAAEPEAAVKKVKQRKPRKSKEKPLTQHATGQEDE